MDVLLQFIQFPLQGTIVFNRWRRLGRDIDLLRRAIRRCRFLRKQARCKTKYGQRNNLVSSTLHMTAPFP